MTRDNHEPQQSRSDWEAVFERHVTSSCFILVGQKRKKNNPCFPVCWEQQDSSKHESALPSFLHAAMFRITLDHPFFFLVPLSLFFKSWLFFFLAFIRVAYSCWGIHSMQFLLLRVCNKILYLKLKNNKIKKQLATIFIFVLSHFHNEVNIWILNNCITLILMRV